MTLYSPFTVTSFFDILNYFLLSGQCPILKNFGGYPTCNNYQTRTYDFIIVGAGAAGCTLANRLSENPNINVLLVEEGPYPSLQSEIPLEFIFLQRTQFDHNVTILQDNMFQAYKTPGEGRMCQGRTLGGGTTVNAMIDLRGVAYDYNRWADIIGDSEWSYDNVVPYFNRVSAMVETTQYISINPLRFSLDIAARELGYSVNNPDDIFGFHDVPIMIRNNEVRNSMANAYLKPAANRGNLCVVANKSVRKVIIDPTTKIARGVLIKDGLNFVEVYSQKEVIISAGAINSAKILMLSGVGPQEQLITSGIKPIEVLPVGNLLDHVYVPIFIKVPNIPGLPTHDDYLKAYCTAGFPMNNIDLTNFIGLFNTKEFNTRQRLFNTYPNVEILPAAYPMNDQVFLPHALNIVGYNNQIKQEMITANKEAGIMMFVVSNLHPKSQGTIELNSTDPYSIPVVKGNYLNDPEDSDVLIDTILSIVVPLQKTKPFVLTDFLRLSLPKCDDIPIDGEYYKSRDYWLCYLRHFATSELHPMGTCRMGSDKANSVVDSHMRVHGIGKLRVVDTSSMPATISGHPTTPAAMMGEKASEFILGENGYI